MAQARTPESLELGVGDRVGGYLLEHLLGEGGMGIVYRALREADGRYVALKILKHHLEDPVYRRRFLHEARTAREVRHRHLVPIVEAGEHAGRQYLVVEYVAGRSLDAWLRNEGPLPLGDVVEVAVSVGAALDALHEKGFVHRDVKPSNILVAGDGTIMLGDLGLAKGSTYTVLTKQGQLLGTLDYLAPELIRGESASPAGDLYALGCVVYECLVGKPPFRGRSVFEVGFGHLQQTPPDPAAARSDVSRDLAWAVLQALQKDVAKRPPSGIAYAAMLRVAAKAKGS